jgi:DNA-binding GntR family transcriptional regulator
MPYATTGERGFPVSTATVPPARSFLNGSTGAAPSRTEAVLDAIKHAILAGELRPGQSLVETELAQVLGVSKTPVREALKTLAGAGLVTMSPYRGATVRAIDPASAAAIYDLRLLLEPEAVRRAVQAHAAQPGPPGPDTGPWAAAQAALAESDAAAGQAQRSLANRDFHRALYLGCGNSLLVKTLDDLRDQTALVSALSWEQAPSWQQEAAEHRAILAAAQAGAAGQAAVLLRGHIEGFAARHFSAPGVPAHAPATEWSTDAH